MQSIVAGRVVTREREEAEELPEADDQHGCHHCDVADGVAFSGVAEDAKFDALEAVEFGEETVDGVER